MTYLSRIRINPLRAESRKLLASPHIMHGAVLGGIPEGPAGERVLWRLDSDNPRRPALYVLTKSKPDWSHIVEAAGWPDAEGDHAIIHDYSPLLAQIAVGREFAFRLTANPVQNTVAPEKPSTVQRDRSMHGGRRSFRVGHRTASAQLRWFLDRTQRWGFRVPEARMDPCAPGLADGKLDGEPSYEVRITARDRWSFTKGPRPAGARNMPVVLHTATYEGRLQVTDTKLLTEHLLGGIGPAKAYGCGLLTLAPLPAALSGAGRG
jgi:CRISPR system Cascade subunit CasE